MKVAGKLTCDAKKSGHSKTNPRIRIVDLPIQSTNGQSPCKPSGNPLLCHDFTITIPQDGAPKRDANVGL